MTFSIAPMSNVMQVADAVARQTRLMFSIPFAYRDHRLGYLLSTLRTLADMPVRHVEVFVNTDTEDPERLAVLEEIFDLLRTDNKRFNIRSFVELEDPFYLTWKGHSLIPDRFLGQDFTHWFHLEDDNRFSYLNLCYFVYAREILRPHGLIPSFMRYEWNKDHKAFYGTDHCHQADITHQRHIDADDVFFMTLNSVYNATAVLDQELAAEFVQTRSFDQEASKAVFGWWTAERAAMGLAWENVPEGHNSRMVIPVRKDSLTPAPPCLLHHLPNNYTLGWYAGTNIPEVKLGRLRMDRTFVQNGDPGIDMSR